MLIPFQKNRRLVAIATAEELDLSCEGYFFGGIVGSHKGQLEVGQILVYQWSMSRSQLHFVCSEVWAPKYWLYKKHDEQQVFLFWFPSSFQRILREHPGCISRGWHSQESHVELSRRYMFIMHCKQSQMTVQLVLIFDTMSSTCCDVTVSLNIHSHTIHVGYTYIWLIFMVNVGKYKSARLLRLPRSVEFL